MKLAATSLASAMGARTRGATSTNSLVRHNGSQLQQRKIKARFDSQFTTSENERHWAMADAMSIDASASWMIRRTLRMRNRYEFHNNGYYGGLAETIADYTIGEGPRLQMCTPNRALNRKIEKSFADWCAEVGFGDRLHMSRLARVYNGESFLQMRNNPGLCHPVKLDLFEFEADQVSSPMFGMYPAQYPDQFFDGIVLDPWGRPQTYNVLRQHPGAFGAFVILGYEFDPVPARYMLHDYRRFRPGQQRGIPELNAVLELFAKLRRYGLAVLGAAENAARHALGLKTDATETTGTGPDGEEVGITNNPGDIIDLPNGLSIPVFPAGADLTGFKAEQPTTTFEMFVNAMLREISRCANVPLMFVTLDPSGANMSSSYVVTQPFIKSVKRDRANNYNPKCDRILDEFLTEAIRVDGVLPADLPDEFPHVWRWPRIGQHADPMKVANAHNIAIKGGFGSIAHIFGEDGEDPQEALESNARFFGMTVPEYQKMLRESMFATKGNPPPASEDAEPVENENEEIDPDAGESRDDEAEDDDDDAEARFSGPMSISRPRFH